MNGAPQQDGHLIDSQLVTSTDNHRNGRPLLMLVPEYIPAEVSLENLGVESERNSQPGFG